MHTFYYRFHGWPNVLLMSAFLSVKWYEEKQSYWPVVAEKAPEDC